MEINRAISSRDGTILGNAFYNSNIMRQGKGVLLRALNNSDFQEILTHRISAHEYFSSGDYQRAFAEEEIMFSHLVEYFSSNSWIQDFIMKSISFLKDYAEKADADNDSSEYANVNLGKYFNALQSLIRAILKDTTSVMVSTSKKRIIFGVSNLLIQVAVKLDSFQACKALLKSIEEDRDIWNNIRCFPVADVVVLQYYLGRQKMLEDEYSSAREYLQVAFNYCPKKLFQYRRRILTLLAPVEMVLGIMPTHRLASVYGHHELYALSIEIQRGNISQFDVLMRKHQFTFIKHGIYLVLERARMIAYRNIIKRIHYLSPGNLKIDFLTRILTQLSVDSIDMDELECILANLIFQQRIRGSIHHPSRTLVLSKNDPFPSLTKK